MRTCFLFKQQQYSVWCCCLDSFHINLGVMCGFRLHILVDEVGFIYETKVVSIMTVLFLCSQKSVIRTAHCKVNTKRILHQRIRKHHVVMRLQHVYC